jgi:hypothetical protein
LGPLGQRCGAVLLVEGTTVEVTVKEGYGASTAKHHRQANDRGREIEIAERISNPARLRTDPHRIKPSYSDTARFWLQYWRYYI